VDNLDNNYEKASKQTITELRDIANSESLRGLSELSLSQVDQIVEQVGQATPSGSVPGIILRGLARLPGRQISPDVVRRDTNLLFSSLRDHAVFGTFFAGPAAVIWGYQNILRLAGKNPEDAFPEGYWQFYVDYALREDTARHANETHGFDTLLNKYRITLDAVDRITAWVMASIQCLVHYDQLLQNEWRERVYLHILREEMADTHDAAQYQKLYNTWAEIRPYRRGSDVKPGQSYADYRMEKFDHFMEQALRDVSKEARRNWVRKVRRTKRENLNFYQNQMSILAYLESGRYSEARRPIKIEETQVGLIYKGQYFFIPVCRPNSSEPNEVTAVRAYVNNIVQQVNSTPADSIQLADLARAKRVHMSEIRKLMRPATMRELDRLQNAPILLNMDRQPFYLSLSELRQAERGIGVHAMTVFDTQDSFVFDQSHIFFDGTWGAALAEIMTNEATAWGVYLNTLPKIHPPVVLDTALHIRFNEDELQVLRNVPKAPIEVSAETEAINLRNLTALRRVFKLRSDLIQLTVNDLLVLYRAIHAYRYEPDPLLLEEVESLIEKPATAAAGRTALKMIRPTHVSNPSILIPVDASRHSPRDRLHPMNFQVPIHDLDILQLHEQIVVALDDYHHLPAGDREKAYARFDELQRKYLSALAGLGTVFDQAKEVATAGKTASVETLKLLAHLPKPLQHLLDKIPNRFEILNDIIKGREVFSNVGAVAGTSSLLRFMSAKDDNDGKWLTWGVLTDAERIMRITLRDFRPHVSLLCAVGRRDLAVRITRDYLNGYASGLNDYIRDLRRITMSSRETRVISGLDPHD